MTFSIYSIISLAVVFINWLILLYVSWKIDKSKRPVSFTFLLLVIIIWQMVELVSRLGLYPDKMVILWKISAAAMSFLGVLFFFVTVKMLRIKIKYYYELLSVAACFVVGSLALFTDKIIKTTELMSWGNVYIYGDLFFLFMAVIDVFLFLAFLLLVQAQKKETDARKRKYLIAIAVGFFFALVGGSLTDLIFPFLGIKALPIGGMMTTVLFVLVMMAMKRFASIDSKISRYSIGTQIFVIFFLIILAYVGVSNYYFIKFSTTGITNNLSSTTKKISDIVVNSASETISNVIGGAFIGIGTRTANKIEHFLQAIELDAFELASFDVSDKEALRDKMLSFYKAKKAQVWYNSNTDIEPVEVKKIIPLYSEITFINASGTETIKISDGKINTDLRDVSIPKNTEFINEDFFQKTIKLDEDEVYVSRVNTWYMSTAEARKNLPETEQNGANWDNLPGRDQMKTGNIKFSTPVFVDGKLAGVFALSLDYRHLQELVKHIDPAKTSEVVSTPYEGNYIMLFDDQGDAIVHPKPNNIRGYLPDGTLEQSNTVATKEGIFNLKDYNKSDAYQKIYEAVIVKKENYITTAVDVSGRRKVTISLPIFYNQGEYKESGLFGGIMMSVATDKYYESLAGLDAQMKSLADKGNLEMNRLIKQSFLNNIIVAFIAAVFLLIILMFTLYKTIFYPLKVLSKASEDVADGNFNINLDVKTTNEFYVLARLFEKMIGFMIDSKNKALVNETGLEKKVEEKTKALNKILDEMRDDRERLEKQRTATLNILEDVSQSQLDLKKANDDLAAKSQELAALKSLSDEFVGVFDIFEAVMVANNYLVKFFDFITINYLVINPAEEGGLIYTTYLQEDVSEKYLRKAEKDLVDYISDMNIAVLNSALNIIKNIVPKYIGKKLDNNLDFSPAESLYFPLTIGEKNLGTIQMTLKNGVSIINDQKEFIKAIVLALSFSIDRLETLILAQHSKTVSLVESLTDGVVMFNSNKDVVLMNPAFAKYTGFSREYFNLSDLYKLLSELSLQDMVNNAMQLGQTAHVNEVSLIKRFYEIFITPVRDNKGKIVGGAIIIHDITFLKEIDQMKTEFVSVASHQLRTPLTAIKLFTEMLVRGDVGKLNPEQQEYLENVNESTERMVSLVNDLLNVTRIESGRLAVNPQPVNIVKFIKNIIAEAKPLISSRTQQIVFHDNNLQFENIPLDENLIRQVIHNLVVNAIRYSPEKNGLIEVALNKYDEKNFVISVKDNGIGIPPEAQRRIFEKFYRADNAIKSITEGTGLGLYVSKMIVVSSGGKIWFESKKGEGTEFFVELPLKGMEEKKGERGLAIS